MVVMVHLRRNQARRLHTRAAVVAIQVERKVPAAQAAAVLLLPGTG
jgi:hypothetical protein